MKEMILKLKKAKNAVILSHHYQSLEVKEVADFVGDSLELAKIAAELTHEVIILCGVHFMAETVKILAPDKKVFLPNPDAGCPMADMVTKERLIQLKSQFPNAQVVTYVNSSADVKAHSDICCTSSNAVSIVKSVEATEVLFVPDKNLGSYVQSQCPDKTIHLWRGFCPTHHQVGIEVVKKIKFEYPNAVFFVHPECNTEVLAHADYIGSTAQIIKACEQTTHDHVIIGTEQGVVDTLRLMFPYKRFDILDPLMFFKKIKKTTLGHIVDSLREGKGEIIIEPSVAEAAKKAIFTMLERS